MFFAVQQEGGPTSYSGVAVAAIRASIDAHLSSSSTTASSSGAADAAATSGHRTLDRERESPSGRSSCEGGSGHAGLGGHSSFRRCSNDANQQQPNVADLTTIPELADSPESRPEDCDNALPHHGAGWSSSLQSASMRSGSWRQTLPNVLRRSSSDSTSLEIQPGSAQGQHPNPHPVNPTTSNSMLTSTLDRFAAYTSLMLGPRTPVGPAPWQAYGSPPSSSKYTGSPPQNTGFYVAPPLATQVPTTESAQVRSARSDRSRSTSPVQPSQQTTTSPFANAAPPPLPQPHRLQASSSSSCLQQPATANQPHGLPRSGVKATPLRNRSRELILTPSQHLPSGGVAPLHARVSLTGSIGSIGSRTESGVSGLGSEEGPRFERHSISDLPLGFAREGFTPATGTSLRGSDDGCHSPRSLSSAHSYPYEFDTHTHSRTTAPSMGKHRDLPEVVREGHLICAGESDVHQYNPPDGAVGVSFNSNRASSESQVPSQTAFAQRVVGDSIRSDGVSSGTTSLGLRVDEVLLGVGAISSPGPFKGEYQRMTGTTGGSKG